MKVIFKIMYRTIFFYFFILISYKIMGKREVGELSIIDFVMSNLISQLIAISIENYKDPISFSLVPLIILVLIEVLLAFISLKNKKIRDIIDGKESIIISNGKLNFKEMRKQRYSLDDLFLQLRDKEIRNIEDVEYAILENNGKLSIYKKDPNNKDFPLPLIVEGTLEKENLKTLNKDYVWLNKELKLRNIKLEDVFYAFYKNDNVYFFVK